MQIIKSTSKKGEQLTYKAYTKLCAGGSYPLKKFNGAKV